MREYSSTFIYIPPATTRISVDIKFPFNGKEYQIKEVSIKDYHLLGATKNIDK